MENNFGDYTEYYDLLYQDKDYSAESVYVQSLLRRFRSGVSNILELGCGTGRHAEILAEAGYHVLGVEISESMLSRAKKRAQSLARRKVPGSFNPVGGDARRFRTDQKFDAVVSLFHVVSYQVTNEDVSSMFRTVTQHLAKDGIFVFDAWYGPAVVSLRPTVRVKRIENEQISVIRIAEPDMDLNRNRVDVNYTALVRNKNDGTVKQITECHPMRYYFAPELELLGEVSGLKIIHSEEWLTATTPSSRTWGVTFVAQKSSEE